MHGRGLPWSAGYMPLERGLIGGTALGTVAWALAVLSSVLSVTGIRVDAACDVCNIQLRPHAGAYRITATKAGSGPLVRLHVRVVNESARPGEIGGSSAATRVRLNFVTPRAKGTRTVTVGGSGRPVRIGAGANLAFDVTYPYRLGAPGVYRFDVSAGGSESNVVTYRTGI